jgi:hypothetical protein
MHSKELLGIMIIMEWAINLFKVFEIFQVIKTRLDDGFFYVQTKS